MKRKQNRRNAIRRTRRLLFLFLLVFSTVLSVGAQNLLEDNPHARRARELRGMAAQAIEDGRYEEAIEYAEEAERERRQAVTWAEEQVWAYRAHNMRNRALEQIAYAERIDAATHYPEEYRTAMAAMEEGEADFTAKRYEESFPRFRLVRDTLSSLTPVRQSAGRPLPRYYVVRLIPENRDTFNKIAGYDFVYGDRTKWRPLYEANRHILRDPDNPHLIHPGMRFEIPSLEGEERSGTWEPPK